MAPATMVSYPYTHPVSMIGAVPSARHGGNFTNGLAGRRDAARGLCRDPLRDGAPADLPVRHDQPVARHRPVGPEQSADFGLVRSEEHTSELQSLMRNSYAVFCLKKTTNQPNETATLQPTLQQ